ncbi:MAG: LysM peptidoglycan-binding domain-containing protein [Sphingobacteriales bacterium JAD_PAG50586_3]|nr:MAG: LysM peptidoglycan-binding domain-containing protein [Sphingobacteriales bacterium JAD_PAG50586_3]
MFCKRLLILFLFAFGALCAVNAQPVPVAKDTTRLITLNNTRYYLFTPQAKQTLYSIAKAYNVTVDEITELNPLVKENGLKIGQAIKIPVNKGTGTVAPATTTTSNKPIATQIPPSIAVKDSAMLALLRAKCAARAIKKRNTI